MDPKNGQQVQEEMNEPDGTSLPNWFFESLEWMGRRDMADSALSTSSRAFQRLCWPKLHGNVPPHTIEYLAFDSENDKTTGEMRAVLSLESNEDNFQRLVVMSGGKQRVLPIAKCHPPEYIIGGGFKEININFVDDEVVEFIELLLPLLDDLELSLIFLEFNNCKWKENGQRVGQINRLLKALAPKTYLMDITEQGMSITECEHYFPGILGQVPAIFVESNGTDWKQILEWLAVERAADGQEKILNVAFENVEQQNAFIEHIKEEFLCATRPMPFLIWLGANSAEFQMENEQTGEQLALYHKNNPDYPYLVRHPKEDADWEGGYEKLCEVWPKERSKIHLCQFDDEEENEESGGN